MIASGKNALLQGPVPLCCGPSASLAARSQRTQRMASSGRSGPCCTLARCQVVGQRCIKCAKWRTGARRRPRDEGVRGGDQAWQLCKARPQPEARGGGRHSDVCPCSPCRTSSKQAALAPAAPALADTPTRSTPHRRRARRQASLTSAGSGAAGPLALASPTQADAPAPGRQPPSPHRMRRFKAGALALHRQLEPLPAEALRPPPESPPFATGRRRRRSRHRCSTPAFSRLDPGRQAGGARARHASARAAVSIIGAGPARPEKKESLWSGIPVLPLSNTRKRT